MQVFLVEVVTYITRQMCVSMVFILSKVIRYKIKLKNLDMQNQLMILIDWYTLIQVKEQDRMERITVTLKELFLPL